MSTTATTSPTEPATTSATLRRPRWNPRLPALLAASLHPIATARQADQMSFRRAYLTHFLAFLLAWPATLLYSAWSTMTSRQTPFGAIGQTWTQFLRENFAHQTTAGDVGTWIGMLLGTELICLLVGLLLALLFCPWAAVDEPVHRSIGRTLRRLSLLSGHFLALIIAAAIAALLWNQALRPLLLVLFHQPYAITLLPYRRFTTLQLILQRPPALAFAAVVFWLIYLLFAAVMPHRRTARCRWPALCEGCGYALLGLGDDSDHCPECGKLACQSTDHLLRPGSPLLAPGHCETCGYDLAHLSAGPVCPECGRPAHHYLHSSSMVRFGLRLTPLPWLRNSYAALRRPTWFGHRLRLFTPRPGYGRNLAWSLIMLAPILLVATSLATAILSFGPRPFGIDLQILLFRMLTMLAQTPYIMAMVLIPILAVAVLLGLIHSRGARHNLLPAAAQATGYLSSIAVLWLVLVAITGTIAVYVRQMLGVFGRPVHVAGSLTLNGLLELLVLTYTLATLLLFANHLTRIVRAMRYANV